MERRVVVAAGELTFNDLWQVLIWHRLWRTSVIPISLSILLLIGICLTLTRGFVEGFPPLFTSLIMLLTILWSIRTIAKRSLREDNRVRYEFTPVGYDVKSAFVSAQVEWRNVRKAQEIKEAFVFYPQAGMIQPIPKRFFQNEADIEQFRQFLRFALADKAKLLTSEN